MMRLVDDHGDRLTLGRVRRALEHGSRAASPRREIGEDAGKDPVVAGQAVPETIGEPAGRLAGFRQGRRAPETAARGALPLSRPGQSVGRGPQSLPATGPGAVVP